MTLPNNEPSEYPVATPEVAKLLGMAGSDPTVRPVAHHAAAPEFLPVDEESPAEPAHDDHGDNHTHDIPVVHEHSDHGHDTHTHGITHHEITTPPSTAALSAIKLAGIFVLV